MKSRNPRAQIYQLTSLMPHHYGKRLKSRITAPFHSNTSSPASGLDDDESDGSIPDSVPLPLASSSLAVPGSTGSAGPRLPLSPRYPSSTSLRSLRVSSSHSRSVSVTVAHNTDRGISPHRRDHRRYVSASRVGSADGLKPDRRAELVPRSPLTPSTQSNLPSQPQTPPLISPKIQAKFNELEAMIAEGLSKRMADMDAANLAVQQDLDAKYASLAEMNTTLQDDLQRLMRHVDEIGKNKQLQLDGFDSNDIFKNLEDLNARLDGVRANLSANKARLADFDASVSLMEQAKKKNLVAQKTRQDAVLGVVLCLFVLLLGRIAYQRVW